MAEEADVATLVAAAHGGTELADTGRPPIGAPVLGSAAASESGTSSNTQPEHEVNLHPILSTAELLWSKPRRLLVLGHETAGVPAQWLSLGRPVTIPVSSLTFRFCFCYFSCYFGAPIRLCFLICRLHRVWRVSVLPQPQQFC